MAENAQASHGKIAQRYEGKSVAFNPDLYINSAERLIKTAEKSGKLGTGAYLQALDVLREGIEKAEKAGKATPELYAKFSAKAKGCEPNLSGGVLKKFEDFVTRYEFKARHR